MTYFNICFHNKNLSDIFVSNIFIDHCIYLFLVIENTTLREKKPYFCPAQRSNIRRDHPNLEQNYISRSCQNLTEGSFIKRYKPNFKPLIHLHTMTAWIRPVVTHMLSSKIAFPEQRMFRLVLLRLILT